MLMRWGDPRCACCTSWQAQPWQLRRWRGWRPRLCRPFLQRPGISCSVVILSVPAQRSILGSSVLPLYATLTPAYLDYVLMMLRAA